MTVKLDAVVAVPKKVVTAILPLTAPVGTVAVSCVSLFTTKGAATPPKLTAVVPANPVPFRITLLSAAPEVGRKPKPTSAGAGPTTRFAALVAMGAASAKGGAAVEAATGRSTLTQIASIRAGTHRGRRASQRS